MEIGILHLTDIHFEEKNNFLENKHDKIFDAIKNEINGLGKFYIIITGDLINKGNTKNYQIFNKFIINLIQRIEEVIPTRLIMIPGNHDCDFNKENQVRKILLTQLNYETIGEKDKSVIDNILEVQNSFWENYQFFNQEPDNKIFYQITDHEGNFKICFNCFNTAWMSSVDEKTNLFFPVKLVEDSINIQKGDLNIALLHHPIVWFRPDGINNNRKELASFIEEHNSLILFGHEHQEEYRKSQEFWTDRSILYFSGKILQNPSEKTQESGFNFLRIGIKEKYGILIFFEWKESLYIPSKQSDFILNGDFQATKRFKSNLSYLQKLNSFKIPVSLENGPDLLLSELFVYPDLERKAKKSNSKLLEDLMDSEKLINEEKLKICIIEGENQSGKTSLINMLYKKAVEEEKYPLILDAKQIKNLNIELQEKLEFEKQYASDEIIWNKYKQHNKTEKLLFIDNFQEVKLTPKGIKEVISLLEIKYSKILIFSNNLVTLVPQLELELDDVETFTIRPLGYKKRNKLIEKFHKLNSNSKIAEEEHVLLEKTKDSFEKMNQVLGNKLLPSYPIFVLSILQTLTYSNTTGLDQTSYGHCYHSLIYLALAKKAKIENEFIDTYFNFLSGFSLYFYNKNSKYFLEKDIDQFYEIYSKDFHIGFTLEKLKTKLIDSKLIQINEDEWTFTYKYIYYFLVAKKLAEIITKEEGKLAIKFLCQNIHIERNANILIFIAHHSKDEFLIQEATFTAMTPFENIEPITLNKNGNFYNIIKDIINSVSSNILEENSNSNPSENRDKLLEERDEQERIKETTEDLENNEDIPDSIAAFFQAFRALDIVGQIIKNRKGSIPTEQLVQMIIELYNTAFRTISYFGSNLLEAKEELSKTFSSKLKPGTKKDTIERKINSYFQLLALNVCLGVFGKVIHSVGQRDLKDLFLKASEKIGSTAADLVTFSINSYYGNLSKHELTEITKKYEGNIVAMEIIKARVKSFIYQNNVDYKKKQAFASILKMQLKSSK